MADLPGLIEGASDGAGLGTRFLGHLERCGVLLHLIDGTQDDVIAAYDTVRTEITAYDPELSKKPEIIAINKTDSMKPAEIKKKQKALEKHTGEKVFTISAAAQQNLDDLLLIMLQTIDDYRAEHNPPPPPSFMALSGPEDA